MIKMGSEGKGDNEGVFCEWLGSQQCRAAYKWGVPIIRLSLCRFRPVSKNNEPKGISKNECILFKREREKVIMCREVQRRGNISARQIMKQGPDDASRQWT
jgi:hypothetical protein